MNPTSIFAAPPDMVVPATLQQVMLIATVIGAVVIVGFALRIGQRQGSVATPVLMVFGGLAAILMETLVTFLGHAVHPENGQITMFKAADRAIPWHIALGYMVGFGWFYLSLYGPFMKGTLKASTVWTTTLVTALCYFVGEAYFVSNGLWAYYGYQPMWLWKGTAPVLWNVLNATCMLTSFTLMAVALPHLKGVGRLLLVPLGAAGACMGHFGAGFIHYNTLNAGLPAWGMELGGWASAAMALVIVWLCTTVLTERSVASSPA